MLYFDNSATTPIHPEVAEKLDYINREHYANPSSIYNQGRKAKSLIENARKQVADAIGAKSDQIFFTSGGTEAAGIVNTGESPPGSGTTTIEYATGTWTSGGTKTFAGQRSNTTAQM